jgi:Xaa-Pro aminopeptidase
MMRKLAAAAILAVSWASISPVASGEPQSAAKTELRADLINRREAVAKAIGENAMLILFSAEPKNKTNDVDYVFRQNNNLYYLTGITQEGTTLVLLPGSQKRREFLFVKDRNPRAETWTGRILNHEEAASISGIEQVYSSNQFERFIEMTLDQRPWGADPYAETHEFDKFFDALRSGQASIFLTFENKPGLRGELTREFEFADRLRDRFLGITIRDAWPIIRKMRQIKSDYEVEMIRRAVNITAEAHMASWKASKPSVWEYEVQSVMESVFKRYNTDWAYPSIIGAGPNATTMHYEANQSQAQNGDLILMDAAAAYDYYCADVTRTVPVNGRFSPEQAAIYRIVYEAQEACIRMIRPGARPPEIHKKSVEVIKEGLKRLGLITDTTGDQYRMWYMHGVGHSIGLDVHDAEDPWMPVQPNMAFTVEPGIYIRGDTLDNLAPTPENLKLKESIRPAFDKYRNIGVRIEDDVLVTNDGCEVLSSKVPRALADIEAFFARR